MSEPMVRVIDTATGGTLWEHPVTGAPFVDYVPAEAFRRADAGEVRVEWDGLDGEIVE